MSRYGQLAQELSTLAQKSGLDRVGVAPAAAFSTTRRHLEERKAAGLHGGMHFTYGNPARSTDPGQALLGARAVVVGARSYRWADPQEASAETVGRVARYSWHGAYAPLEELLARFERWYVPRRQARYLRRNALVALGNVGDGHDPGVARVLAAALGHPDPIVSEHAECAALRLGRSDLVAATRATT